MESILKNMSWGSLEKLWFYCGPDTDTKKARFFYLKYF